MLVEEIKEFFKFLAAINENKTQQNEQYVKQD